MILDWAGHPVARASAQLIPTLAGAKLARLLEVTRGTPLLRIDQVDDDAHGRAVTLSHEWHVADAFELIVNRRSSAATRCAESRIQCGGARQARSSALPRVRRRCGSWRAAGSTSSSSGAA